MLIIIIVLLISISALACANNITEDILPYDLPNEVGTWISVNDTTYESPYYLIGDSIFVGYISLANESPREFFLRCKSNPLLVQPLIDVDIPTFEVNINKDKSSYARDKNAVYYPRSTSYGGGPEFFDGINGGGVIYYGDISIEGADPQTFQYIGSDYALDKNDIYYKGRIIHNADLQTFKVIGKGYAIDKDNMYYRGDRIKKNDHIISALQQDDCPGYLPVDYGMTKDD